MFNRPGFRTSEFFLTAANFVAQVALAWNDSQSTSTSVKYSLAGAVAYILSRGLAKYEPRPAVETKPPAA